MTPGQEAPEGTEPAAPTAETTDTAPAQSAPAPAPRTESYSLWSPIAADTSGAPRPHPDDVKVLPSFLLFLAPIVVLGLGAIIARSLVWDQFLDPYIWTPIVEDEGFNLVNTTAWVVLLGLLLFFAVRATQKMQQEVDFALVLAVVPYIIGGSIARVLEDTGYFGEPLRFFFITPIIYVVIFLVAVLWLALGHFLARQARIVGNENALYALAGFLGIVWVGYLAWSIFGGGLAHFGHPLVLLAAFVIPYAYLWNTTKQTGRFSKVGVMAVFGTAFLLFMIYMAVLWHTGVRWDPLVSKPLPPSPQANLWVYPVMFLAPALITAIVYLIARSKARSGGNILVFLLPINLLVIYAQAKDAILTAIGIDFLNYQEKHVLPGFLIDIVAQSRIPYLADYAATAVMIPVKLGVAILVVWLIDVYAKNDLRHNPTLVGLAKLAIIMVGLAPGTRNAIRMAFGV